MSAAEWSQCGRQGSDQTGRVHGGLAGTITGQPIMQIQKSMPMKPAISEVMGADLWPKPCSRRSRSWIRLPCRAGRPEFSAGTRFIVPRLLGRPTALTEARRLSAHLGRGRIYLKREDLNHTGAHKINNALGQALLACAWQAADCRRDGAGQHGVATAPRAPAGPRVRGVYGTEDMRRQRSMWCA